MLKAMVFVLAFMLIPGSYAADLAVGKVDIQKVLVTIKEGKEIRKKLKKTFDKRQAELKKDEKEFGELQEKFKKQSVVLSDKAKATKSQELQKKYMTIQNKQQKYQQEMQKLEQQYRAPIMEKLQKIVDEVSKKKKVDITFEQSTAPVLFAKNVQDLTDEVIKLYDKKHP